MKIAYLILAHHQPEQLLRLYRSLDQPNAYFYIHIDKKSTNKEEFLYRFKSLKNVQIISEYNVYWFGFNMVKTTLALLKLAFTSENSYKYFVLLSGQDYPVKSNTYINEFFSNHDCDFIDYNKINHIQGFSKKYTAYHYYDLPFTNPRSAKKIPALVKFYYYLVKAQDKFLPNRKFYNGLTPYFGPQWFALTYDTVKYVLGYLDGHKDFMDYMKFTEGPDETFFQTIICNSPRKTNLWNYGAYLEWEQQRKPQQFYINPLACLVFMDWSEKAKTKPAVLNMGYFDEIRNCPNLFARKIDQNESKELMAKIDREILNR